MKSPPPLIFIAPSAWHLKLQPRPSYLASFRALRCQRLEALQPATPEKPLPAALRRGGLSEDLLVDADERFREPASGCHWAAQTRNQCPSPFGEGRFLHEQELLGIATHPKCSVLSTPLPIDAEPAGLRSQTQLPSPLNNPWEMLAPPEGGPMSPGQTSVSVPPLEDPVPAMTI